MLLDRVPVSGLFEPLKLRLNGIQLSDHVKHILQVVTIEIFGVLRALKAVVDVLVELRNADLHVLFEPFPVFVLRAFDSLDNILQLDDLLDGLTVPFLVALGDLEFVLLQDIVEFTV